MSAFWASFGAGGEVVRQVALIAAGLLLLGPLVARLPRAVARWVAWALALGAVLAAERVSDGAGAGWRMLAIIGPLLLGMKVVVATETHPSTPLSPGRWLLWASAWPGMCPELFAGREREVDRGPALAMIGAGALRLALGLALIAAARALREPGQPALAYGAATACALVGISLVLHFGLFGLLAGGWRALGVASYPLFPAPLTSTTLGEFWGRRWNLPFTEMIQRAVYRPLSAPLGRSAAALAGFATSGLLHELAISVPVKAGYGLPALYFLLHGVLMLLERRWAWLKAQLEGRLLGRVWTLGWLALPMPILFHGPFLTQIVWPLIGVAG